MTLDRAKHKNLLIRILKDIYTDPVIGPVLGFKGGTAANLFYGLDRFSVDLDFDLLDQSKKDVVYTSARRILEKYGLLTTADKKRYSLLFVLAYEERLLGEQKIKIEINLRDFESRYEIKPYLGISMKVMIREDMAANKLVAFYERIGKTSRDIYDAWFFFANNWPINRDLVERRTNMPFTQFVEMCCELVEKMDNRRILQGLGELMDANKKPG